MFIETLTDILGKSAAGEVCWEALNESQKLLEDGGYAPLFGERST